MKVHTTALEGILIIDPDVFGDDRGFFLETYNKKKYQEAGINCEFVQDNHSRSIKGVIRGLHYQRYPGQAKLVRCTKGRIFDVAVDIRKGSKTFGKWIGIELSEENKRQIFIPVGFAHGFATMEDLNDVMYKCSNPYDPKTESGIAWNDRTIGVEWPITDPIISNRDSNNPTLNDIEK